MKTTPLIKLDGVAKQFSKGFEHHALGRELTALFWGKKPPESEQTEQTFWALQDIRFEVTRGEVLGVIGHNGAGKTTLLRLLNREYLPDRGTITMHGHRSSLIDLTGGFSFNMTGRENIYFRGAYLGFDRAFLRSKEAEILDFTELGDFIDSPIRNYSSGMLLRLGFAITVFAEPEILLMDEILSVGDFLFEQKCMNRINKLRENSAVVMVTHSMSAISNFADKCLVLDRGLPVFLGKPVAAIDAYYKLEAEKARKGLRLSRATPRIAVSQLANFETDNEAPAQPEESPATPAGPAEGGGAPAVSPEAEERSEVEADTEGRAQAQAEDDARRELEQAKAGAGTPSDSRPGLLDAAAPTTPITPIHAEDAPAEPGDTADVSPPGADNGPEATPRSAPSGSSSSPIATSAAGGIELEDLPPRARAVMHEFLRNDDAIRDVSHHWLDATGEPVITVSGADAVTLKIEFSTVRKIRRLVVGVPVWSEDGVLITAFGTHARDIAANVEVGRHSIVLQVPAIRLNKGRYFPAVAILDQNEFLYRWPTTPLIVTRGAEVMTWGMVTLDYSWEQPDAALQPHRRMGLV
jgi:lipopolysaccharide transport system ATP-binding protein